MGSLKRQMQFVIIGNGIAGMSAAFAIRRLQKEARIIILSEDPNPTYSPCILPDYLSGEINRTRVFIRGFLDYLRENIQLSIPQKVVGLDIENKNVLLQNGHLPYDRLIIATGSKPMIPSIPGLDKEGVFTFKSIGDVDKIHTWKGFRAVVVGSGPIGVEVGLALKNRGYQVSLVECMERILPQVFDEYPSSRIQEVLEKNGIEVTTGERIIEILGQKRVEGVLSNRGKRRCDTVILATGMRPERGLVDKIIPPGEWGGIKVNHRMETGLQDIYACGDCVETASLIDERPILSLLWHNARRQGEAAGINAAGISKIYPGSLPMTGLEVFDLRAFSIGYIGASIDSNLDIIEERRNGGYRRAVLSRGVIVGIQSINWEEDIGFFFSAILRKEKMGLKKAFLSLRSPLFYIPKPFPLGRKFFKMETARIDIK